MNATPWGGNTATYFDLFMSQVKEMNAIPCGGNAATHFNLLIYLINHMDAIPFGGQYSNILWLTDLLS